MKAYHYLIIIAAVLGIWYYIGWKKEKSVKTSKENKKPETNKNPYDEPDTSDYASVAEISTKEALALAKKSDYVYILADSENLEDHEDETACLYEMNVGKSHTDCERYKISKRTFKAIIAAGYEPDYN